ncbi:uncharacterized protein LOC121323969 isoform X2 [Polyodon spathula]|uniref:uncharacterized protein LOC121323969 isoform X2 n=1 Tax=Polyodon spathula TaxID=7913 RepID=UPI001B7E0B3C|nr:uncharacterized protein LOC121323969 isoform X2 [Polyodon spathula]
MDLSTEQALALLLILNSAHLTAADCSTQGHDDVTGSAGGRTVLPCYYTLITGQYVKVNWYAYRDRGNADLLIDSKTPSAHIPVQWSGRVKLSDEVSTGNASLLISGLRLEDARDYTCSVWVNQECITYQNVRLTIQGPPKTDSPTAQSTPEAFQSSIPAILAAVLVSAAIGIIANANSNNQNARDQNVSTDMVTYAIIDHTRQPGGAPDWSRFSAVGKTEYATVLIH